MFWYNCHFLINWYAQFSVYLENRVNHVSENESLAKNLHSQTHAAEIINVCWKYFLQKNFSKLNIFV